jgi:twitching motility protein PilU
MVPVTAAKSVDLSRYLRLMTERGASDLFLSVGAPVHIKVEGVISRVDDGPLAPGSVEAVAFSLMDGEQASAFRARPEMNLAFSLGSLGRFRVNVFRQRGEVSMVVRHLKHEIPSIEELHLPLLIKDLAMLRQGLVLFVGPTGSGKSTSLATMIDHRNQASVSHILTIEDPVEYLHRHKQSVVEQREVGIDTLSYGDALMNAMREAPDVILIGEVRERETLQHAIAYAETGHLCLSTLHANNAQQALQRITTFFPEPARPQVLLDLALNLQAIVSQRLIKGVDGKRVPAVEVLLNSPYVAELIQRGSFADLRGAMEQAQAADQGMQTFDESLYRLFRVGWITREEALRHADSATNLGLRIRLGSGVHA